MSKLIIHEPPLQVLPSLAKAIGLNEAIVLQQIHYWLQNPKSGITQDGHRWIFNTYDEWQEQFSFWSVSTIQRVFSNLEKRGLLVSKQLNKRKHDMTKFYTIDYGLLDKMEHIKLTSSEIPNWNDVKRNTETTTETTHKDSPNGKTPPEKSPLTTDLEKLESAFSLVRKVPLPDWGQDEPDPKKKRAKASAAQKIWRTPLKEIYMQCGKDTQKAEIIICEAVENMRRDGLTFTKPVQILEVATSLIADRGMVSNGNEHNPQPAQMIILSDGQIVEAKRA